MKWKAVIFIDLNIYRLLIKSKLYIIRHMIIYLIYKLPEYPSIKESHNSSIRSRKAGSLAPHMPLPSNWPIDQDRIIPLVRTCGAGMRNINAHIYYGYRRYFCNFMYTFAAAALKFRDGSSEQSNLISDTIPEPSLVCPTSKPRALFAPVKYPVTQSIVC